MTGRIGIGFDSHALAAGRRCVLGGVEIPYPEGPVGHSDGDAVLHALADALLGAAGLDDLGTLFPDSDERWKGADSAQILQLVADHVRAAGYRVVNIDIVVATDGPRIAPHRTAIRERIGAIVGIPAESVNIKGKSLDGLALAPMQRAVAAYAISLLQRHGDRSN